jgi:PKHD-type hydroxylase
MILTFADVITQEEHAAVLNGLKGAAFVDGRATAGRVAATLKNNRQLDRSSPVQAEIARLVLDALRRHEGFCSAVQPKQLHSLLVSRYEPGMDYGLHIDNALMGTDVACRSDVSLTLFLGNAHDYEGGELALESGSGELHFKLDARALICYPSTTLHRVMPVRSGVRLVAVAWVQSLVRDPAAREVLHDIDTARRALFEKYGPSREFDLLNKSHANLLRRWAEL